MRASKVSDGVSIKAYGGTTGVLLAFDVAPEHRQGLLGFAIEREGGNRPHRWLSGMLHFPGAEHKAGDLVESNVAPIQKFRWSDYSVYPNTEYTYTVHPVHGTPTNPDLGPGPTVTVRTSSVTSGEHKVLFNRAAAASQAFERDFPGLAKKLDETPHPPGVSVPLPAKPAAWLSRGVLEQITGFCARALDPTWALDVGIYEYELKEIRDAIDAARARGANTRIIYHADPSDNQTKTNEANVADWPPDQKRARVTSSIFHDKFIVLSRMEGDKRIPEAVLCGSTNFTDNGVFRQANVIHVAERTDMAAKYLALFDQIFGDPPGAGLDVGETRKWINENDPLSETDPIFVGFSPRTGGTDLALFVKEIGAATRDILFCTAFELNVDVLNALKGADHDSILRFGLENLPSAITGYHRDRTDPFVATAALDSTLDDFLKESYAGQGSNIHIHTKLVVLDFTSDAPTVISGSHNLSHNASANNDENYLIIRGNSDVADCYGVELMRLYDHYRFRWQSSPKSHHPGSQQTPDPCPERGKGELCPNEKWATYYFEEGSLEALDRERFAASLE
jgi:phosphatidylserine/phosphatidylglycerophosphate/cardiolipin synthase-like enzyme